MYDIVIIGGGPGGYTCAIRAAQLGGNVCLIEKDGLGGTCTQRGCIPTKYLHSVGDIVRRGKNAKKDGLNAEIKLDFKTMKSRMQATVSRLASGINLLLKRNGVNLIDGEGYIISKNELEVNGTKIETKNIVIATGGHPACLTGHEFGGDILSTTSILELDDLPTSLTIVGAGYSGCEFASILNALGCKVSLIEAEDHILPKQIPEIGNAIEKYMTIEGINVRTGSKVDTIVDSTVVVNGEKIESEKILVCTGRRPNIVSDELNKIGVRCDSKGIVVNNKMRTSVDNVYAIGDITGLYDLAHVAAKQGEVAAENIFGMEHSRIEYDCVPACVFTYPEVAFVGTLSGTSGEFPLTASAKANCIGDTRGTIKVYEEDGILTGAYIIGPHAGEMIAEAALAIKMGLSVKDIADTIHAHPTLPEAFQEAVMDTSAESIHLPPRTRINSSTL